MSDSEHDIQWGAETGDSIRIFKVESDERHNEIHILVPGEIDQLIQMGLARTDFDCYYQIGPTSAADDQISQWREFVVWGTEGQVGSALLLFADLVNEAWRIYARNDES
jgi:hypothetical protein